MLLNDEHRKFWDAAKETVLKTMPSPLAASLEPKLKDYRGGYGSVSRMVLERLLWIVLFVRVGSCFEYFHPFR